MDSLVDLAEKQEIEQAATGAQIRRMRQEIQGHITQARSELQDSIQWLAEHKKAARTAGPAPRKEPKKAVTNDNSSTTSSGSDNGGGGRSTKRFRDPRQSLEKLSEKLRRQKERHFGSVPTEGVQSKPASMTQKVKQGRTAGVRKGQPRGTRQSQRQKASVQSSARQQQQDPLQVCRDSGKSATEVWHEVRDQYGEQGYGRDIDDDDIDDADLGDTDDPDSDGVAAHGADPIPVIVTLHQDTAARRATAHQVQAAGDLRRTAAKGSTTRQQRGRGTAAAWR